MQLAIELPDEMVADIQNVLKHKNVKQFAQEAVQFKFLEEQKLRQQKKLMALIRDIEPVKPLCSSEDMVRLLREGKEEVLKNMQVTDAKKIVLDSCVFNWLFVNEVCCRGVMM